MPIAPTVTITKTQLAKFEKGLGRLVRESGGNVVFVVFKTAVDLMRDITIGTPVDTGRARAAWTLFFDRIGRPFSVSGPRVEGTEVAIGKSEGLVETNLTPAMGSRAGAMAAVPTKLTAISRRDHPFAEIRNNVKYILPLEFGWTTRSGKRVVSKQAPAGFVRHNIRRHARFFLTGLKSRRRA